MVLSIHTNQKLRRNIFLFFKTIYLLLKKININKKLMSNTWVIFIKNHKDYSYVFHNISFTTNIIKYVKIIALEGLVVVVTRGLVPPPSRVRPSMCTPVTPAVPYLLLLHVQWAVGNSRGARKLARTPHVNKKNVKIIIWI